MDKIANTGIRTDVLDVNDIPAPVRSSYLLDILKEVKKLKVNQVLSIRRNDGKPVHSLAWRFAQKLDRKEYRVFTRKINDSEVVAYVVKKQTPPKAEVPMR